MKIQIRILLLMLGGIGLSFLIFTGITLLTHDAIQESTAQLVEDFSKTTATELWQSSESQGKDTLLRLAASQAHQADDLIVDVVNDVKVLSKSMTRISKHPEYYNERTIADPLKDKIMSGQAYILYSNEEIAQNKALRHEIGIASTIQDEMVNIALTYKPHRVSVYAASEHGYFLTVDIMPDDGPSDEMDGTHIFEARERTWYLAAKKADKLVFSDVYMDYVTGKPCITCGAPYYDNNGFAGVLGFGMYLDVWHDVLMDPAVNPYPCFVLTDKGEVVVSSHETGDLTVSTGNDIRKALSGTMAKAATEMVDKKSGVRYVEVNGIPYYLAFAPMKTIGWSLGILTPVDVVHNQADGIRGMFLNMLHVFQKDVDAS
ncbi:MAG: cache domain-containing protein, partial [Selenomonas sp.]|nr:cache domain-containing protein [Selenomonas sp.]